MKKERRIFVTVGTTEFDALIRTVDTLQFHAECVVQGYTNLVIQYGRGDYIPSLSRAQDKNQKLLDMICFRYKSSLNEDLHNADLVIGHSGAGTILETLRAQKRLIVVTNQSLMNNHQVELGLKLHQLGYLICTTPESLIKIIRDTELWTPITFSENTTPHLLYTLMSDQLGINVFRNY